MTESFEDVQNALNQVLKQQGIWRDFLQQISDSLEGIFLIANERFSFVRDPLIFPSNKYPTSISSLFLLNSSGKLVCERRFL